MDARIHAMHVSAKGFAVMNARFFGVRSRKSEVAMKRILEGIAAATELATWVALTCPDQQMVNTARLVLLKQDKALDSFTRIRKELGK